MTTDLHEVRRRSRCVAAAGPEDWPQSVLRPKGYEGQGGAIKAGAKGPEDFRRLAAAALGRGRGMPCADSRYTARGLLYAARRRQLRRRADGALPHPSAARWPVVNEHWPPAMATLQPTSLAEPHALCAGVLLLVSPRVRGPRSRTEVRAARTFARPFIP